MKLWQEFNELMHMTCYAYNRCYCCNSQQSSGLMCTWENHSKKEHSVREGLDLHLGSLGAEKMEKESS